MATCFAESKRLECLRLNIWLSLFIFNPLESIFLLWVALEDKEIVLRKKNIKHFYILGTINFALQYFIENLEPSILNLFLTYIFSIFVSAILLKIYILKIMKMKVKLLRCIIATSFVVFTIMFGVVTLNSLLFKDGVQPENIITEIIVNLFIKFIQLLILLLFGREYEEQYFNHCSKDG